MSGEKGRTRLEEMLLEHTDMTEEDLERVNSEPLPELEELEVFEEESPEG